MKNFVYKLLSVLGALVLAVLIFPKGADALTISPPYIDHRLNPGDTVMETGKLYNENADPITIYPIKVNFKADDKEGGQPQFVPDDGTGMASWIDIDSSPVVIGGYERVSVPFTIAIPADAPPGGHFGAVLFSTDPPSNVNNGVGVSQQLALLVLVRVAGDVVEEGDILEFGFENPKPWYNYLPVNFFMRFQNNGNSHLRPAGNLFIKDIFGRQVASIQVNEGFNSVLPQSVRRFTFKWMKSAVDAEAGELVKEFKNFAIGPHTATLVIYYGEQNKLALREVKFYVWPWRIIILTILTLILVITLIRVRGKMMKKKLMKQYKVRQSVDAKKMEADLRAKIEREMRGEK